MRVSKALYGLGCVLLLHVLFRASCNAPRSAADPTNIGFVYVGPCSGCWWTYEHDRGRLAVEKELR